MTLSRANRDLQLGDKNFHIEPPGFKLLGDYIFSRKNKPFKRLYFRVPLVELVITWADCLGLGSYVSPRVDQLP